MADRALSRGVPILLLIFMFGLVAYGQSTTKKTAKPNTGTDGSVTKAIQMNVAEVEAGKVAAMKAEDPRVKDFANMMVKDHTDAITKLRAVQGAPLDVTPSTKHQQTEERLSKLSGADFD